MVRLNETVIWHDVECASYAADLDVWEALAADAADGPLLDIGCGTGRVALHLAALGHDVVGLDSEPELVQALAGRARAAGLAVDGVVGDARSFVLEGRTFALAIAPMQVVQLLGGTSGRAAMLETVRSHLRPGGGGMLAIALADPFEGEAAERVGPPMPDVHEEDGWLFSSLPIAVRTVNGGATAIDRVRQAVSPAGELTESMNTIELDAVTPEELEEEARRAGFEPLPRREVPPTDDYVGSTVVILST
ncbi:MAG: methyltransferase domain-containing protein [Thermoleophilaceae bacterium]